MSKISSNHSQGTEDNTGRLRKRLIPLLGLLFVIGIVVGIFYFCLRYPGKVEELAGYSYLGAFLISLILNATVILPAGSFVVIATLGATLPSATLVGLLGGAGAAIGEIMGYVAGYTGRAIVQRQEMYVRLEAWVKKWGVLTIFVFSLAPFIFDLVGIAAGVLRLPLWKFLLACWLGRTILYVIIALAGARGWEAVLSFIT